MNTLTAETRIAGYVYTTSPKDGLPVPAALGDKALTFTAGEVAEWHVSRNYGSATERLGATLRDGRLVFVVRSQLPINISEPLGKIAAEIRRSYVRHSGDSRTILFKHGPKL